LKAAVISIGTEVTSGEISNTNASLLASKLTDLGITCELHLSVPDSFEQMKWALQTCVSKYSVVITTGGLGPTTDDFTRQVIADVIGKNLIWDETSWKNIESRLKSVNAPIVESNKQQAWFPESAEIFQNLAGTAAAFSVSMNQSILIALPGPPHEIESLWESSIRHFITSKFPNTRNIKPLIWRCLGMSESKIGEIVEAALNGSGLTIGYRSFQPFIDVKVWVNDEQKLRFEQEFLPELEKSLEGYIVSRNNEDLPTKFWDAMPMATPIFILDRATGGHLAKRLNPLKGISGCQLTILTSSYSSAPPTFNESSIVCTITANPESGAWQIALTGDGPHKSFSEVSRYRGKINADRLAAYVGEKAILKLTSWFST
jgi:molybdenum cofactor synthesis domain-containing protein